MPNPSSVKDLITDFTFCTNLKMRLQDEQDDLVSNSKIQQMTNSIRHLASGQYGHSCVSWNPNIRSDTRSKKRQFHRMNQNIRMINFQNMMRKQAKTQTKYQKEKLPFIRI